ncbi:MAG: hypothetical protein HQL48_09205, partial [Gammaproteobacteria bacterium]|nr:hypothetical protein [Gammaproteobacteria bacterium]
NEAGSGKSYAGNQVIGFNFEAVTEGVSVESAATSEWVVDQISIDKNGLQRFGDTEDFFANRYQAEIDATNSINLADGSQLTWGEWSSGDNGSFILSSGGEVIENVIPEFRYMIGQATAIMPTTGQATFTPSVGYMQNITGDISVNFLNRNVAINNLGFSLEQFQFSGLNGGATYSENGSGFFKGNYSSGICAGCSAFSPAASVFTGNFIGNEADGLLYSTIMQTGEEGTKAGVHAFTR